MNRLPIVESLKRCAESPRVADRRAILLSLDKDLVTAILTDTYDKSRTYGVTTRNVVVAGSGELTVDTDYPRYHSVLDALASRSVTGNAAIAAVAGVIQEFRKVDQQLLLDILDRNIAIGVSLESWQKMAGLSSNKFAVPLAYHLDKAPGRIDPLDGTYYASHKLDGVRLLARVDMDNEQVAFYSRSGKEYRTLGNLVGPLLRVLAGRAGTWAVDGECCHLLPDGSEDFQGIIKQVTRKDYTIPDPHYCIFDLVPWSVFTGREVSPDFSERYRAMLELPHDDHVTVLEQERVTSKAVFDAWVERVSVNGWEGFILRKDAPFRTGRTTDLLKVKPYDDAEFVVVDIVAGKQTFAVKGCGNQEFDGVKDIVIELPSGDRVNVGGGLTKEQRLSWLADPGLIVGKTVTVKFLEETTDKDGKHSLRHPTLKCVHGDSRDT